MLLNDAYAGHRKWWSEEWQEDPKLAPIYTEWDYVLIRVYQYIQDFTTGNGNLIWVEEDPDVQWDVDRATSFYERELHKYREDNELKPWESPRAKPIWEDDIEPPSMEKWLKAMEEKESSLPQGGTPRPPTAAELAAMDAARANP